MPVVVEPQFIGAGAERRFTLLFRLEETKPRAGLVFVAPLAEEMNKSRRMVALAARALAARDVAVLVIDLYGTGDSEGDFADADWKVWLNDVHSAHARLARIIDAPVGLWGLRLGTLIAASAAQTMQSIAGLLLWQPVVSGKAHLTQFLRLKIAADAMAGAKKQTTQQLIEGLALGCPVEVAGYTLSGALATGMANAQLELPENVGGPIVWTEVSSATPPALLPASTTILEKWRAAGKPVQTTAVSGTPFWQTQEIEISTGLLDSLQAFPIGRT